VVVGAILYLVGTKGSVNVRQEDTEA
jgi:hypothetical protein